MAHVVSRGPQLWRNYHGTATCSLEDRMEIFNGAAITGRASSIKTHEWEMINETLAATGYNISETARQLGMHRRTLARKLEKRPIR